MKTGLCLSIQQPWAWLIVRPDVTDPVERAALTVAHLKDVENRDWPTKVRGVVGIHAGKTFDREGYEWIRANFPHIPLPDPDPSPRRGWSAPPGPWKLNFSRGGIIGRANLVDCVTDYDSPWFFGEYGFVLRSAEPLPFIPCRGMLGFFKPEIITQETV
jgi:hypothetical protein